MEIKRQIQLLEEGKVDVQNEWVDLNHFFTEIEEDLRPTLKAGQKILVECTQEAPSIFTDSRILRNVIFNLISNASKYSDADKKIHLTCTQDENEISISVTDEGIGIPKDDIKHIFERFFRATNATNIQGTGLGLNIVKRYADLLGGQMSFNSTYGIGSTFTITLPIQ